MATTPLEIEAIKNYLIDVGCKIEYPILVNAFKKHLYNPDPNVQGLVRTQFKDYVNRLATVSLENNMKFIILRPEFRPAESQMPSGSQKHVKTSQSQHPSSAIVDPQNTNDAHRGMPSNGRLQKDASQPRQPRSKADQSQQPSRQQHVPLQLQKLNPHYHDHMDSPQQHNQQHFQFPTTQSTSSSRQQIPKSQLHQTQQQQPQAPPQPHNDFYGVNNFQSDESMNGYHRSRSNKTMNHDKDNVDQQKRLPPTPQYHSRSQSQPISSRTHIQSQPNHALYHNQQQHVVHSPLAIISNNVVNSNHLHDDSAFLMPPPPPPPHNIALNQHLTSSPLATPRDQATNRRQDTPTVVRTPSTVSQQMPPPRPPPRRRQSTASLFKPSPTKPIEKMSRDLSQDRNRKVSAGRVNEHATRFNSSASTSDLSALMPKRNSSMKENRLSRESVFSGLTSALQRNGSQSRSRSSHRGEDESDSSSLQPIDPLRRKWAIEACSCNYNNLVSLLHEDPKLASCKDIVNGYTALHWAAKFGNLDIIKLIAGTYQISANTKSSGGHTPLHVAYMFNRLDAANLLMQSYRASQDVRDHSGKKPKYYMQKLAS